MATSLAQQLKNLRAPQTSVAIADARSRASILFNPKEAATKDRRAIYEIGLSGLQELASFDPTFNQFQQTLFDEASMTLERSVEKTDVNKLLDRNISKFLRHLSPYFLLRPAHMCFEWLLRRFQVHQYNRSAVMALILPYHETNTFVQVLQTMRLSDADTDWDWLRPLQKGGVTLPKSAIVNRAASVPGFLGFICRTTQNAIKELGPRASQLQAQINFYTTVVVGALQTAKPLVDWHITMILESLLRGLVSDTVDFVAAAYVITAQLVSRTKLKTKVCNALLERVANCSFERLHTTALLLLILILDAQQTAQPEFTPDTILNLACQKWLISELAALSEENISIQSISRPLVRGAVMAVSEEQTSAPAYQKFLNSFLDNVPLGKASAQQLIDCFLDTYAPRETSEMEQSAEEDATIVIDSDDEVMAIKTNFQTWYAEFLERLERRYPEAFDLSIKEAMGEKSKSSNRRKALQLALGFRLNTTDERAKRAYEKLYHYNAEWRLSAVKMLLTNLQVGKKRERSYKLLKECLADRLNDDSAAVVAALLTLPTDSLVAMLGAKPLAQALCRLLQRAHVEREDWLALVPPAVQHLTSGAVSGSYDNNLVLLALMPYLFPVDALNEHEHKALLHSVASEFCGKLQFLNRLQVCGNYDKFKVGEHRQRFLDAIGNAQTHEKQALSAASLLASVEQHGGAAYLREPIQLTHLLLLLTAYATRQLEASESLAMLQCIEQYSKTFQFGLAYNQHDSVPLQLYCDFLHTLIRHTNFEGLASSSWLQPSPPLRLCLLLLDVLTGRIYGEQSKQTERHEWQCLLKQGFNLMLPHRQQQFEFLINFYIYETWPQLGDDRRQAYATLRLRGFKLLQALLSSGARPAQYQLRHVMHLAHACASPLETLRVEALQTLQLLSGDLEPHLAYFVQALLQRRSELGMDQEQYALILYTILEPVKATAKEKLLLAKLRRELLALLCSADETPHFTAALLQQLKHVNDESLLSALLPLGLHALQQIEGTKPKQLQQPYNDIYKAVAQRFESDVAVNVLLRKPNAWDLFELSFARPDVYIQLEQKLQPLPCVLLLSLTPAVYERLLAKQQLALIELVVQAATQSDNDGIFLAGHKLLRHCRLKCRPLVGLLAQMASKSLCSKTNVRVRRSAANAVMQLDLTSEEWKRGLTLLELLEHKKHLLEAELLIQPLFELLNLCLALDQHSAAEYPKQLILSLLLHCCQTAEAAGIQLAKALPESCFRIEQVVQCLRNTQNPQTQQQALLFLTHCAGLYPQQVLHKIVEIFTFVGSTVARHDDAFSLHIINNVVLSIVPTLLAQPGEHSQLVNPILKVFSDICIDVPVHRRLPLYATLFGVLPPQQHLWQFLCIVIEAQMLQEHQKRDKSKARLEFAHDLILMFAEPTIILETCVHLMDYLARLPDSNDQQQTEIEQQLFDVRTRSYKQLRHYKYLIMDYLVTLTSSPQFQVFLGSPEPAQLRQLQPLYKELILKTLAYVSAVNAAQLAAAGTPTLQQYWGVIGNSVHDVLDNAIGLLSPAYFLGVITELLRHELINVRIKVLELLNNKLAVTNEYFAECPPQHFGQLFAPLGSLIDSVLEAKASGTGVQQAQLQQAALNGVQLLARRHGREYIEQCGALLATLTRIAKRRAHVPKAVLGNVVLTLVEICASLKAHALAQLPKFMPQLTEMLREKVEAAQPAPDYLSNVLVTAFQKLFAALPLFLGPYLADIIGGLTRLSTLLEQPPLAQDKRAPALKQRITNVWSAMAQGVEARILVPSCAKAYASLLAAHRHGELGILMQLLLQCLAHNTNAQLQAVRSELSELFMQALELRVQLQQGDESRERLDGVESAVIEAFVAWTLKLSETSFRPMYARVHKWAWQQNASPAARLTYFRLTNKIAEALKSLFVLFASDLVEDAARLLPELNTLHTELPAAEHSLHGQLLTAMLGTLHHVFLHNGGDFINSHRFNALMPPIVDQLENGLVLQQEPLQHTLTACIAQLALAMSSDVLWKQLNNQVLLKTRNTAPAVRILAFNSCVAIARKLGDSFAPLLPETVPFIAELLEDEHEPVEKNTRRAVQELESILGESVQKYL